MIKECFSMELKKLKIIFFVITQILFYSINTVAQTSITIYSSADNTIDQYGSTTNRGACDRVYITGGTGTVQRGLYKFDLSSLPASAIITSGTLYLYRILGFGSGNVNVHRLTSDWTEGSATCVGIDGVVSNWTQRANSTNWSSAGGDYNSAIEATKNVPVTTYTTNSWDIQSLIQGWVNGTYPNYGLIVKQADESSSERNAFVF